jgi:hypothetical protein
MGMMFKIATGSRLQTQTKSVDGGYGGVVYTGPDFTNSNAPNGAPTDNSAEGVYAKFLAKNMTTSAHRNFGGATKVDGTTIADDTWWNYYHLHKVMKLRKIAKRVTKFGVLPGAPTTKKWDE